MNTLSPQTTGLECASPGIAVFQRTFSFFVASHLVGAVPSATPEPLGQRNVGQLAANAVVAAKHVIANGRRNRLPHQPLQIFRLQVWFGGAGGSACELLNT